MDPRYNIYIDSQVSFIRRRGGSVGKVRELLESCITTATGRRQIVEAFYAHCQNKFSGPLTDSERLAYIAQIENLLAMLPLEERNSIFVTRLRNYHADLHDQVKANDPNEEDSESLLEVAPSVLEDVPEEPSVGILDRLLSI